MKTSFFCIANMSGIACASDSDHTIYQLAKEEPLAVAVDPSSPIPWDTIIESYRRKGEPQHHERFVDYANDFSKHLESFGCEESWRNLPSGNLQIAFLGYGTDDLYPYIYTTFVRVNEEKKLSLQESFELNIDYKNHALWEYIGDFDNLMPIFDGITLDMDAQLQEQRLHAFEVYKKRVNKKFVGTKFEQRVKDVLDNYDIEQVVEDDQVDAMIGFNDDVKRGLDSFSLEELVYACEKIVNANIRLEHIYSGSTTPISCVKEIAVITRAEGLTWIKHSLFAI